MLQLKLHRIVNNHENIIQFYGITKKKSGKYKIRSNKFLIFIHLGKFFSNVQQTIF